jgi:hypothetical protein
MPRRAENQSSKASCAIALPRCRCGRSGRLESIAHQQNGKDGICGRRGSATSVWPVLPTPNRPDCSELRYRSLVPSPRRRASTFPWSALWPWPIILPPSNGGCTGLDQFPSGRASQPSLMMRCNMRHGLVTRAPSAEPAYPSQVSEWQIKITYSSSVSRMSCPNEVIGTQEIAKRCWLRQRRRKISQWPYRLSRKLKEQDDLLDCFTLLAARSGSTALLREPARWLLR